MQGYSQKAVLPTPAALPVARDRLTLHRQHQADYRGTGAAHHDALRQFFPLRCCRRLVVLRLLPPAFRRKGDVTVYPSDFGFGSPARCAVLAVADCFGFDVVQVIDVGKQRNAAENGKHHGGDYGK